jgi:hypothetical protein
VKLAIRGGSFVLSGFTDALAPRLRKWFGLPGSVEGGIAIAPRRVLALTQHYRGRIELSDTVRRWLDDGLLGISKKLSRHLHDYRGGYQVPIMTEAFSKRSFGAYLDAGAGKSVLACEFAKHLGPTLLVVPPIIWRSAYLGDDGDLTRFYPGLRVVDATEGAGADRRRAALQEPADLYAVSPYTIGGVLRELLDLPIAGIVWDESSLGRNPRSNLSQTMRRLASKSEFKLGMSADPCPNNVGELWAQIDFLEPGRLKSYDAFCGKYGERTRYGYSFPDTDKAVEAVSEVRDRIVMLPQQDFWHDRPRLNLITVPVELGPKERQAYDAMDVEYALRNVGEHDVVVEDEMSKRMKLRELTFGFVFDHRKDAHWVGERSKLRAIMGLIKRATREQWIIWTQFRPEADLIVESLRRANVTCAALLESDRDMARSSDENLAAFQKRRFQVLITHTKSAAHGVRLTNACNMVFSSLTDDNDAVYQATRRIYRPPQHKDCNVYFLVANRTVDEQIMAGLRLKMEWRAKLLAALRRDVKR